MKFFVDTLGCPKNVYDSDILSGLLLHWNHIIVENYEEAEVIIVNTCGFINDAKVESIDRIFDYIRLKTSEQMLIVSGCLSKRYASELALEMEEVDLFIGVNEYERLEELIQKVKASPQSKTFVSEEYDKILKKLPRNQNNASHTCTLKIAEGCNNSCAYCVIPSIRGSFRSKTIEDILKEGEELAHKGCKELILIAQDLTLYGEDIYGELALPRLLKMLCKIDGIKWIRLMYCYEDRITDELVETMKSEPKICSYIDIPLQHSSDNILKAMKRRSTSQSIKDTIHKLRTNIPDIHIRTTLIVGFPGETDEDFDELIDFVEETKFDRLGVFAYSREENTVAGDMDNQIEEETKNERVDAIMRRQIEISLESNKKKIGKTFPVIVEGTEVDHKGITYIGRTAYDAPEIDNNVIFTSPKPIEIGEIVEVKIVDAYDYDLVGETQI